MKRHSDEQLVALTLQGQEEAFAVLVERYQKQIFSLAYRLHNDYDEARDLAQEAFIHIYQRLPSFDQSRKFFPWMYRVAQNVCINVLRGLPKETLNLEEQFELEAVDVGGDPARVFEGKEAEHELARILMNMPEQYRAPVLLKYMEGLSYREISERLDLPESTIETRLFRGRKYLREILKKNKALS